MRVGKGKTGKEAEERFSSMDDDVWRHDDPAPRVLCLFNFDYGDKS